MAVQRHELVVVANRLPVTRSTADAPWEASPGGLVRALLGLLRTRDGAWVGWPGMAGEKLEPFEREQTALVPVHLSADEVTAFYDGFANETLWPLYHDALRDPVFDDTWWEAYQVVNRRFAEVTDAVSAPGATVWVHDYQLQLVPALLRERRPDLRIGFFLHTPFPPQELFLRLPWREAIVRGLLGADVIGVQRKVGATNLASVVHRLLDGVEGELPELVVDGRVVHIDAFPISIDVAEFEEMARRPDVRRRARLLRSRLGDPDVVFLGVDRLDYTKGIDVRLEAYRDLLEEGELSPLSSVFVQTAVPTRERLDHYVDERRRVEEMVGNINGEYGQLGLPVVHYQRRSLDLEELVMLYLAADVMTVTPLRDGMNLVAKEFVTTRLDDTGVLVLSEFAGSADELDEAVLVNPFDRGAVRQALLDAARMSPSEATARMRALRRKVSERDVAGWARAFLAALEEAPTR